DRMQSMIGKDIEDPTQPDGTRTYTKADAIKDWKNLMASTQADINAQAVAAASGSDAQYLAAPLMDYMGTQLKVLQGVIKQDVADQAYQSSISSAKANMIKDDPK